jgi:CheY-like chemotaxis protein
MKMRIMALSQFFRRKRDVGGDTRRLPSLVKAMRVLVPKSVMREVMSSSHDRRQWGVLAAAWVGVSEREFVSAAARELHMPYHDHVVAPDLTIFGSDARTFLSSLRKVGASVALEIDRIVTFIATDPAEVRGLSLFDGTQTICMAPWTEIAKALDAAERRISEAEANASQGEAARRKELCHRAIDILIGEAVHHGSTSFDIITVEGITRYQFKTVDGKIAVGSIHPQALDELLLYLNSIEGEAFEHAQAGSVVVRSLGNASNIRLTWVAPHNRLEVQELALSRTVSPERLESGVEEKDRSLCNEGVPILVVDDNPMFRRVLQRLLGREGFEISFAENGRDALRILAQMTTLIPRLILCDLHMPEMNGREFVVQLKRDPRWREVPVLMLTSDDGVDAELEMLEVGADALISKTKDPRILCAQVARLAKVHALPEAA